MLSFAPDSATGSTAFRSCFHRWLRSATAEEQKLVGVISSTRVDLLDCGDTITAKRLWQQRACLTSAFPNITIALFVRGEEYALHPPQISGRLNKSRFSPTMIQNIQPDPSVSAPDSTHPPAIHVARYLLARAEDYRCLDVEAPIALRLNKRACLHQPLRFLDKEIEIPRRAALDLTIATGKGQEYRYSHDWNGFLWRFRGQTILTPEGIELIIYDDADWQLPAWESAIVL